MLMRLNHNRRKVASGLLSMFMGSWLLLLCQTCLAYTDDFATHKESSSLGMADYCHSLEDGNQTGTSKVDDQHCLGACDCDALTVTVQSENNSELKDRIKFNIDAFAIIAPKAVLTSRASPGYPYSSSPERAKRPPFYTYNVLLI